MLSTLLPLVLGLSSLASAQAQTVSVSATVPDGASATVNPSFVGWAFEERSFYYFAGAGGSPVEVTNNLINAVASRTGATPFIRVGGSSLNAASYDSTQSEALVIPTQNQDATIPYGMTIGPSYFESFNNINADYQLDIPMTKKTDMSNSVQFTQAAWKTVGSDHISILELGNEPNSYGSDYAPSDYATQFDEYSTAITAALGISSGDRVWQVGSLTSGVGDKWNATLMFSAGLSDDTAKIIGFSAHYYQFSTLGELNVENALMSHDKIVNKMEEWQGTVEYLSSLSPSIPLNFAEVGCGVGHPADGTAVGERSFGAALWQVDYMLYAMSIGINRVNMQSGLGFQFSLFQPVAWNGADADVFANQYASLFVADFISTSGAMQCAEIDLDSDTYSAYAAYESGKLARVAIVNFDFYNGSDSSTSRDSTTFSIQAPSGQTSVTVMRLSSDLGAGAMEPTDITWGGESWTIASNGNAVAGTDDTTTVTVKNGYVSVDVPASEAVMLLFSGSLSSSSTTSASSITSSTSAHFSTPAATSTSSSFSTSSTTSSTATSSSTYTFPTPVVPITIHSFTTTSATSAGQSSTTSTSSTTTTNTPVSTSPTTLTSPSSTTTTPTTNPTSTNNPADTTSTSSATTTATSSSGTATSTSTTSASGATTTSATGTAASSAASASATVKVDTSNASSLHALSAFSLLLASLVIALMI